MHAKYKILGFFTILVVVFCFLALAELNQQLQKIYQKNQSFFVADRNGKEIYLLKNKKNYFAEYTNSIPQNFKNYLIKKEDKYFYWNFGLNPLGMLEALGNEFGLSQRKGSSTIAQQLAKILLENENQRNAQNKFQEIFYALALGLFNSKEDVLKMYANSVYFGNQIQGIKSASKAYFNVVPENLTNGQIFQLLATINNPTNQNPTIGSNIDSAKFYASLQKINAEGFFDAKTCQSNLQNFTARQKPILELAKYIPNSVSANLQLTVDADLNNKVRQIVSENIEFLKDKKAKNAAVVILKNDGQILSQIGSPNPDSYSDGCQIDMTQEARQIGSTVKPFIYLLGFEKGMRPYTLIDDREYKFPTQDGYFIYPKNFDYQYHGIMSAHYALSNSINVAAVKALEFVGIQNFADFFEKDLGFKPIQPIENYQIGIALGAFEMSPLDLAYYFLIFANNGELPSLKIFKNQASQISQNFKALKFCDNQGSQKKVVQGEFVALINKILNDRKTGMDQFGAESNLNLEASNYALKTGTSHDFTDSWIVGYTPDFIVTVWVGNADNTPTDQLSGQLGAGRIWNQVMQLMLNSQYNKNTQFDFLELKEFKTDDGIDYGLADDNFEKAKNIILNQDKDLILNPHDGDVFLFDQKSQIALKAKESVNWKINGKDFGQGQQIFFNPKNAGDCQITALSDKQTQTIIVHFNSFTK